MGVPWGPPALARMLARSRLLGTGGGGGGTAMLPAGGALGGGRRPDCRSIASRAIGSDGGGAAGFAG